MSRSRGSALLLALWSVAILSGIAIVQAVRISAQLRWASRLNEARQGWYLAWAATQAAGQELVLSPDPSMDAKEPVSFGSGWFSYRIQDEQARIPINGISSEQAARLPGFTERSAEQLVARREAGKPVVHLAELRLLQDFPDSALEELAGLVTVYGKGPVNLNTAPAPVLAGLGLSSSMAKEIAGLEDRFSGPEQIIPLLENRLGPLSTEDQTALGNLISTRLIGTESSFFQVQAEGWTHEKGTHTKVIAVLEKPASSGRPVVRGWHEV